MKGDSILISLKGKNKHDSCSAKKFLQLCRPDEVKMKTAKHIFLFFSIITLLAFGHSCVSQVANEDKIQLVAQDLILTGAQQTEKYFPFLKDKSIGLVCNHSSLIGKKHLADTLVSSGFKLKRIYAPEHGFRGDAAAGDEIRNSVDPVTGLPVISIYGEKKKPSPEDLEGIETMIFDIQDVGVRFYTYISTLTLVMEACAEQGIPLIVLDRPNPNAFYVDGPVLDTAYRSFVGMHPVPIVYGMTIGEYARMVNGEGWLKNGVQCDLTVIPLLNWTRNMIVQLLVKPSPNLPNWQSIYLYPYICLFEGTVVSVGRGTDLPFQVIGHPAMVTGSYIFTPRSIPGIADKPPFQNQQCLGQSLLGYAENFKNLPDPFTLVYLIISYKVLNLGDGFFNSYFEKLAGNSELRIQIESGLAEEDIRKSWQPGLEEFKKIRAKYLLYPDLQ
jgi:uncharacterized protein YbbC (DUF1343 family)